MKPDNRFSWRLAQSGRVSVTHQRNPGIVKNQVHIQCDCQSDSLLSDIVSADRQGDVRPAAATLLKKRVDKDAPAASRAASDGESPSAAAAKTDRSGGMNQKEPWEKTLVVRLKSAKHENNELLLTEGKLTLQGEDVIVRDGVPYFQAKSQVMMQPTVGPPAILGSQVDTTSLDSIAAKDNQRNLYFGNSELLEGEKAIMQNPQIRFVKAVVDMKSVACRLRRRSLAESINSDELKTILPSHDKLSSIEAERSRAVDKTGQVIEGEGRELNQVVMVNGRCVLKGNCIAILRGLLHVGRTWHRIVNNKLVGSDAAHVTITGRPVSKDVSDSSQMLMNSATLYSLGNTVYAGNVPLLEDAVLHADGQVISISDLPLGSLCGIPPPEKPEPPRLFVQGGRFSVQNTALSIREGNVWLQDVRMQLPEDTNEEVRVTDSLVFISPATVGQDANKANEARDIIYDSGMLLLDDLTPLLKGGSVCLGDQKQPLVWLSGDASARSSQLPAPAKEALTDRVQMLTDATCILDQHGIYFIQGDMILQGKKVLIDRGVPLFSSETAADIRKMNLGGPPPYLAGRVLLDARAAKELGAKAIADFFVLKNARLDMTDGKIVLNNRVPVLSDCQLIMDRHLLSPMQLGFEAAGRATGASAPASATTSDAAKASENAAKGHEDAAMAMDAAAGANKDASVEAAKANEDDSINSARAKTDDAMDSAIASDDATKTDEGAAKVKNAMPKDGSQTSSSAAAANETGLTDSAIAPPSSSGRAPEKTGVSMAATSTADMEDSGRGTSDWAESSHRAATALGGVVETPKAEKSRTAAESANKEDFETENSEVAGAAAYGGEGGKRGEPTGSGGAARVGDADGKAAGQIENGLERESKPEEKTGAKSAGMQGVVPWPENRGQRNEGPNAVGESLKSSVMELNRDSVFDPDRPTLVQSDLDSAAKSGPQFDMGFYEDSGRAGVAGRQESELPATTVTMPLGDISSNGIKGNFSVISNSADKKLVFSLKARIDEMLNFLDQQS